MRRTTTVLAAVGVVALGAGCAAWALTRPPVVDLDALPVEPLTARPATVLGAELTITDPPCPPFTVSAPRPGPPPTPGGGAIEIEPGHAFTHACL
ncbi:hypothetical protein, partial [Cellulomonas septica]